MTETTIETPAVVAPIDPRAHLQPNQWPGRDGLALFYGDPANGGHDLNAWWEDNMLVSMTPQWKMFTAWKLQDFKTGKWENRQVTSFRVHKGVVQSLGRIMDSIWREFGCDQGQIEAAGLHLYGGAFNFRPIRGSNLLSLHAYGAAIDLNPDGNQLGQKWDAKKGIPKTVIEIFEAESWKWGGRFKSRLDCMHFEACDE